MKRSIIVCLVTVFSLLLICCGKKDNSDIKPTVSPTANVTAAPTELIVEPTEVVTPDTTISVQGEPTEIPLSFQGAGWISSQDAVSLLKTFMGSFDDNGNQLKFSHVETIFKDGRYHYHFKITSLLSDGSETDFGSYIVSTDGIDIEEYNK